MNTAKHVITNLLQTVESILKGLVVLQNESERIRYTDEYNHLIDKIDSIEDKILELGGNLEQIYNNIQIPPISPLKINVGDVLLLTHIFNKDELYEWLKCAVIATGTTNPLDIIIFMHNHYPIRIRDNLLFLLCNKPGNLILAEDTKYFEALTKKDSVKSYVDRTKCICLDIPNNVFEEWLKDRSLFMASQPLPSKEALTRYNDLLVYFTRNTAKAMLNDIRAIYFDLYAEYKKLKLQTKTHAKLDQ